METVLNNLRAVLCDPEGKCCISGSDADRAIVDESLAILAARDAQVQAALAEQEPVAWRVGTTVYDDINMARWSLRDAEHGYPIEELIVRPAHPPKEAAQPEPSTPVAQERETTLQRFNRLMEADVESPIERLRCFCGLAMTGQDWLDVEPFFAAVEAAQERAEPVAPAVSDFAKWLKTREQDSYSCGLLVRDALARLSATPPAPAQPSPEPSKPEQAEAPGDSDPLTPEQEEWVMDLAEKHNLGRRVSQIGTMRGVAPDVFYTDASYRTGELFSFAAELLSTKEQS